MIDESGEVDGGGGGGGLSDALFGKQKTSTSARGDIIASLEVRSTEGQRRD